MKLITMLISLSLLIGCTKTNVNTNKSLNNPINSEDSITSMDECLNYLDMSTLGKQENNNFSEKNLFCNKYTEAKSEIALFFKNHPEYLKSKEKENNLFNEYLKILKKNKNITMYETLSIAHKSLNDININLKKNNNTIEPPPPSNTLIDNKIKTNIANNDDIGNGSAKK
ncbi:hypothetical protein M5X66_18045 (plasmid) [Providencia sp. PROV188]|uniref:hypothetical protein n=1 Tax=Providencia TaxID=586 RepID=UPI0012B60653|nr:MULTISPECIES: hypothetical protein [Providencia]MTC48419.1 hypothetical protein [Providencia alcalifaciens]UNJ79543.1 hypothetical protein [Providencia sp.]WBM62662.1 hypothetical protein M5X66_18045 [Providencia sp. PROV188]